MEDILLGAIIAFKGDLSEDRRQAFELTTALTLKSCIISIQREQEKRDGMIDYTRILNLIEVLDQFDKVVCSCVEGNEDLSDLSSHIWGPIKSIIETARESSFALDSIFDVYVKFGSSLPLTKEHQTALQLQPHLRIYLALIYKDLLDFNSKFLKLFKHQDWAKTFPVNWNDRAHDLETLLSSSDAHKVAFNAAFTILAPEIGSNMAQGLGDFVQRQEDISEEQRGSAVLQEKMPYLEYNISFTQPFSLAILDICKRFIERLTDCPLSWWPLSEPEEVLQAGYSRIYSRPFGNWGVYDDIPTSLADSFFPKLAQARATAVRPGWRALSREAIFLHNAAMKDIIHHSSESIASSNTSKQESEPAKNVRSKVLPSPGSSTTQKELDTKSKVGAGGREDEANDNILFLTIDIDPNESIALRFKTGDNDHQTVQNLRTAYHSLPFRWWRWKRATEMRFYRFDSFLFRELLNSHCVHIHKDQERYPEPTDLEYKYSPQPWQQGVPYPSHELWYLFKHPEICGTSGTLNDMLPKRINDTTQSRIRAFGIHIAERYSILALFVPASVMAFFTLLATLWFIPFWLKSHPDDLQNATVPVTVAFTIIPFFIQLCISVLIIRWKNF